MADNKTHRHTGKPEDRHIDVERHTHTCICAIYIQFAQEYVQCAIVHLFLWENNDDDKKTYDQIWGDDHDDSDNVDKNDKCNLILEL